MNYSVLNRVYKIQVIYEKLDEKALNKHDSFKIFSFEFKTTIYGKEITKTQTSSLNDRGR